MRLSAISGLDRILGELATPPTIGGSAPATAPATGTPPPPGSGSAPPTIAPQDPQAQAKMQAQQALDRVNQKKQIQDQISATQKQLQDLQKQLAAIK